jgi:hypothetical protein
MGLMSAEALFFGRGDGMRTATRAFGAFGVLLLVLAWRLDASTGTAYTSGWTGRTIHLEHCTDCRLPGHTWLVTHGAAGFLAIAFLAVALNIWRRRVVPTPSAGLLWLGRAATGIAVILELVAAYLRDRADNDKGVSSLAGALGCDAVALVALLVFALAIATQTDPVPFSIRIRRLVQRQGVNLIAVVALALILDVVGQTSGQAVDSIRDWVVGDARGMARLSFGLATSFLLAIVVYESSVRLALVEAADRPPDSEPPVPALGWIITGVVVLVVGILAGGFLPLGYGVAVLGGVLVLLGLFELLDLGVPPPQPTTVTTPGYGTASAECLGIIPLLAVSAIALTGAVDAALSDGADVQVHSLWVLVPCLVLLLGSILMSGDEYTPAVNVSISRIGLVARWLGSFLGVGLLIAILSLAHDEAVAAGAGFALLAVAVLYAWILFHAAANLLSPHAGFLVALPVAICAGFFVALAVHWDLFGVSDVLGVFAFVNIALAAGLAGLHYVMKASLRRRPPKFFWALGMRQLPLLLLLVVWWVGAGVVAPQHLHDARVEKLSTTITASTLQDAFTDWRRAQGAAWSSSSAADPPLPLMVVAAHGGGIRAAYWTALVLDCVVGAQTLENDTPDYESTCTKPERRRTPDEQRAAARRVFLASGVSGGAVGLYAYARQLLEDGELSKGWVDDHLGGDFAAATIGWALFHDAPNRFLGIHPKPGGDCAGLHLHGQCFGQDRAAVLEDTFDREWTERPPGLRATWELRSSSNQHERDRAQLVPVVVDNSTVVGGKTRAVTSALELSNWPLGESPEVTAMNVIDNHPLAGTAQVLSALCRTNDMRLSTAALLASRFPYVNPTGRLNDNCAPNPSSADEACNGEEVDCQMALVDGGYTDNSGLFTIEAVLPSVRQLIENSNSTYPNRRRLALVVVEVDNHYRAAISEPPSAQGGGSETLAPPLTAIGGHQAIETFARANAYRVVPKNCAITISPALHPGLEAPLGWELSTDARHDLQNGLVRDRDKSRDEQPLALVRRLQRWLGDSAPDSKLDDCVPDPPSAGQRSTP